jgi:gamma-glutamyltranspeptidase / glutathione hydrolase
MEQGARIVDRAEVVGRRGMVASKNAVASAAGLSMFEQGGNAVDAAIAAAFASGVVEPMMSGLGGGGVMIVHDPSDGQGWCVEFGMRSPALAVPGCFALAGGRSQEAFKWRRVVDDANLVGHRSVAVPGALAGYAAALERWGRLPLATVLEPAIAAARAGVPVHWYHSLLTLREAAKLRRFPAAARVFLDGGDAPLPVDVAGLGGRLVQADLAATLELIAREGPSAFYEGDIAHAIDDEMAAHDGLLRAGDLAAYRARVQPALRTRYRQTTVATAPGPFGGVTMASMLRLLGGFDLAALGHNTPASLHLIAEASRLAFLDRFAHLADPEVVPVPFAGLLSDAYLDERRALIRPDRALRDPGHGDPWRHEPGGRPAGAVTGSGVQAPSSSNTTHLCAADGSGLAVSLTSTNMSSYGSCVVVPGTGVLLNNGMCWFDPEPGRPASVGPSRRPLTNQTPAIVVGDDGSLLAVGASGGRRILDAVAQLIIKAVDHGLAPQAAITSPRMDSSELTLLIDDRVGPETIAALRALGHGVTAVANDFLLNPFASPTAIALDRAAGTLRGGADQWYPAMVSGL